MVKKTKSQKLNIDFLKSLNVRNFNLAAKWVRIINAAFQAGLREHHEIFEEEAEKIHNITD